MHRNLADCGRRLHQCIGTWRTVVEGYINAYRNLADCGIRLHQCIGTWRTVVEDYINA